MPHWIQGPPTSFASCGLIDVEFRFQHKHPLIECSAVVQNDGGLLVSLSQPMRAITPGQYAVFYKDGVCLGSARIHTCGPTLYEMDKKDSVKLPKIFS